MARLDKALLQGPPLSRVDGLERFEEPGAGEMVGGFAIRR